MANSKSSQRNVPNPLCFISICLHTSFINFISSFLAANSFRLNFVPIAPDCIFNCGGSSVAFIFVTKWDCANPIPIFTSKGQFANLCVVVSLGMEIGRPTFVSVQVLEIGFEKIVNIAHARGECKRRGVVSRLKGERKQALQGMDVFQRVITSMPGVNNYDAVALNQAIGSIEAIAKAGKESILENTDLSADKAETITRLFRDPKLYLSPKFN
ncbi:hypothetical protein K2173_012918 [Erythroxylum novogranatense]|uniref:Uncharacterized protein n=1 Tax=Erythroxylum novogranatense TaxID=1862640 RepID=A0AAV8S524_9ROSI|nr:hypothetical protein K2173_012918 [Erythroxylum novogranatense]